jgi:hypothetical protein
MAEGGSWRSGTSDDLAGSPGALGLYFVFLVLVLVLILSFVSNFLLRQTECLKFFVLLAQALSSIVSDSRRP